MTNYQLPTFKDIETYSEIVEDNELFSQYSNHDIPNQYDANFMALKFTPTLEEFHLLEKMQRDYQTSVDQTHLKFTWPQNQGLSVPLLDYLNDTEFELGMLNLYWVTAAAFVQKPLNPLIEIKTVTADTLPDFLQLNYEEDSTVSPAFAEHKQQVYQHQFHRQGVEFVLAYLASEAVASYISITSNHYIEIDNLLTASNKRQQKIAQTALHFTVKKATATQKSVILVADAEDTVKEMYEKMGFQMAGYQISVQKVF